MEDRFRPESEFFWRRIGDSDLPHPRPLAFSTWLNVLFPPRSVAAWSLVCFGMLLGAIFGAFQGIQEVVDFRGPLDEEPAVVKFVDETNATVGETRVYRITAVMDRVGGAVTVASFQTGRGHRAGDVVTVEFPVDEPAAGRIKGLRRSVFGWTVAFVLVFPLAGLFRVDYLQRKARRELRLFRDGRVAIADVAHRQRTSTEIGDQRVYAYPYTFTAADGSEASGRLRTHQQGGRLSRDGGQMPVLYAPDNPSDSMLVHDPKAAPAGLTIDETGVVRATRRAAVRAVYTVPFVALFAVLLWTAVTGAWAVG